MITAPNPANRSTDGATSHDEGAVLPLVLVMAVIGALIVLPLMSYSVSVFRANSVLSGKTQSMEAVRAGGRIAVSDPLDLFERCTSAGTASLAAPPVSDPVTTTCTQKSEIGVIPEDKIPYGAVAVQVGESVQPSFSGTLPAAPAGPTDDWWDTFDEPTPTKDTIWMPYLPERVSFGPEVTGYAMPASFDCQVFFPGTYSSPMVISDRAYFTSGDYYFLDDVTVVGGADAVVGFGLFEGCVDDVQAILDMTGPGPSQYNTDGGGATWVFGGDARLIIDNSLTTNGVGDLIANNAERPLRFLFNQRYVDAAADAGHRISMMSVNGDIDAVEGPPAAPGPLEVPGVITMPISEVQTSTGLVSAIDHGYIPSTHTAEPRPPEAPSGLVVNPLHDAFAPAGSKGGARIAWDTPDPQAAGGATVTRYSVVDALTFDVVTGDPVADALCLTDGATSCVITGLTSGNNRSFRVLAENAVGWSEISDPVSTKPLNSSPQIAVPDAPLNATFDEYENAAQVFWDEPADDGNAAIQSYTATAYRAYTTLLDPATELFEEIGSCTTTTFRDLAAPTTCVIDSLAPLLPIDPTLGINVGYRFGVTATNAVGTSDESTYSDPPKLLLTGSPAPVIVGPVVPPPSPYVPLPILDIDTSGPAATEVEFKGYVSVPQGRVAVTNPLQHDVHVRGGVVAGSFDVDAATTADPNTTVGFRNTVLQRTIDIVSRNENLTSTMTVQINESGEFRVNSWVIQ